MIKYTKVNTIELLLKKFPEFWPEWKEHLEFWGDDPKKEFGHDIEEFTRFIRIAIKKKQFPLIKRIMEQIEEFLRYGDENIVYEVHLGILEPLTNQPSEFFPKYYYPYTGPKTIQAVREIDEFWGTRTPYFWSDEEIEEFNRNKNQKK